VTTASVLGLALASSAGVSSYTVRPGDTLGAVAHRVGVSVRALASANGISKPDLIRIGQVLHLPGAAGAANPGSAATGGATYTVKRGDTLGVIASRNHTTTSALLKANEIKNPDLIRIGQVLRLSGSASPSAAAASSSSARPSIYVVSAGETLGGVAHKLGVSISDLANANRLVSRDMIFVGQVIKVPGGAGGVGGAPPKPGQPLTMTPIAAVKWVASGVTPRYVVTKGDSLSEIAARNRTSSVTLRKLNRGKNLANLTPGTVLTLPGGPVWLCPVRGRVSFVDTWGAPREGGTFHQGTDMFSPRGTPVVASVGGTLELRHGSIGGNAYYLHGDDGTTYYGAHLDAITAQAGRIEAGQQIGVVGDTGDAKGTPTHLHFETHPGGGSAVDSFYTVDKWC
jgi:LysM repeat protein